MKPEARFNKWLRETLPGQVTRIENTASAGVPDIVLICDGQVIWLEVKVGQPYLRPVQYAWGMAANHEGAEVYVIRLAHGGKRIHIWQYPDVDVAPLSRNLKITNAPMHDIEKNADKLKSVLTLP